MDLENKFVLVNGSAEYPFFYYPSGLGFSGKGIELFNIAVTSRLSRLNQISDGTIIVNGNSKFISLDRNLSKLAMLPGIAPIFIPRHPLL